MEVIILIWLVVLSVIIIFSATTIVRAFSVKGRGLRQVIYEVLERNDKTNQQLAETEKKIEQLFKDSVHHFFKTAIVRFNPFERLGGEQSYSVAILNKNNTGLIMTFLYTKEGVRTYVKQVVLGKGKEIELSKEEKEAVLSAS